jgi:nucleoside-diphosphate-sugar epimerase
VQCSTVGVHGGVEKPPADENAPIKPDDYYQETKYRGETLARELCPALGLPFSVIRPAAIYGPRETRFLKLAKSLKSGTFVMFGSKKVRYHFVHVDDLSDAFCLCAERDEAVGEAFIIADDHALTLTEIVRVMSEALGIRPPRLRLPYPLLYGAAAACEAVLKPFPVSAPLHRRRAAWFNSTRQFDITKARQRLGYAPKIAPEVGLKEMVGSYREAGWL